MPSAVASSQLVNEQDYARLVSINAPAIAPDAKHAVAVITRILWDDDKRANDLVSVDLATGTQQTLIANREDLSDPAFSPDGSRIAFLAKETGAKDPQTQLFVIPSGGGSAQQITHVKSGVDQFAWRTPTAYAFAYAGGDSDAPEPVRSGIATASSSPQSRYVARELPHSSHIFVVAADGATTTQLTTGSESISSGEAESTLSWSPDGKAIAFTLVPNAILNDESYSRIALVDVSSKTVRPLTGATAWESDPMYSPDGLHIAYLCSKGDPQVNLSEICLTHAHGKPRHSYLHRPGPSGR